MTIIILSQLSDHTLGLFSSKYTRYRPDLMSRHPLFVQDEIAAEAATALILASGDQSILHDLDLTQIPDCIVIVADPEHPIDDVTSQLTNASVVHANSIERAEELAFKEVERRLRPAPLGKPSDAPVGQKVCMVGSGVVNLVSALRLVESGFEIEVYDQMSDPLLGDQFASNTTGATFGGMDARIFSLNESRHHLFRGLGHASCSNVPFRKEISDNGWLSRDLGSLDPSERAWISRLESVPPWVASVYNEDTLRFNQSSSDGWKTLFSLYPKALRGVNFNNTLLRIYQTEETFQAAVRSEKNLGAYLEQLSIDDLMRVQPCFADAINRHAIAGALRVIGFSLNVKSFSRNLIRLLQEKGVAFHWSSKLDALETNTMGEVSGLRFGSTVRKSDHFVICPGAYSKLQFEMLSSMEDVASMVGMWLTIPNEEAPLSAPLKVRRRGFASGEAAEGANFIPGHDPNGKPVIYCSSGHGFVGGTPDATDLADLDELMECIRVTTRDLFPDKFAEADRRGMLCEPPEYCVRPWTSSGLGVFESRPTASGGRLVLTGGHNTGGFAQAPAVADAVSAALFGQPHIMSEIYMPQRALALTV